MMEIVQWLVLINKTELIIKFIEEVVKLIDGDWLFCPGTWDSLSAGIFI